MIIEYIAHTNVIEIIFPIAQISFWWVNTNTILNITTMMHNNNLNSNSNLSNKFTDLYCTGERALTYYYGFHHECRPQIVVMRTYCYNN